MPIKKTLKTCKAAFLSGKAFKRMEKGNYRGAAIVLMEIYRNIPEDEMIEYIFYSLGQCHYRLGQQNTALYWLSKSIEFYEKENNTKKNKKYRQWYRDAVELYCKVLRIYGNVAEADKIINEIDFGS